MRAPATKDEANGAAMEAIIVERIRGEILSGSLPPGSKLPEELLADTFGVTRGRVRLVLQRLAYEQLVDLKLNRGAYIASPTVKEARDVFQARRVIERVTTEIVARTALTHQIADLRLHVEAHERALTEGNRQLAIRKAAEFHRRLAALAHNGALTAALEPLILQASLIVALYGSDRTMLAAASTHADIVDFIERGESLAAANAMERCLFKIEAELDLRVVRRSDVDLRRIMTTVG